MPLKYIINPKTGRKVTVDGVIGKRLLHRYLSQSGGFVRANSRMPTCTIYRQSGGQCAAVGKKTSDGKRRCEKYPQSDGKCILNLKTGRCERVPEEKYRTIYLKNNILISENSLDINGKTFTEWDKTHIVYVDKNKAQLDQKLFIWSAVSSPDKKSEVIKDGDNLNWNKTVQFKNGVWYYFAGKKQINVESVRNKIQFCYIYCSVLIPTNKSKKQCRFTGCPPTPKQK